MERAYKNKPDQKNYKFGR